MFFFDEPYRNKKFDGSLLLDDQLNLDTIPYKYARQFHSQIYKKLVEILNVTYSDYPVGKYFFIPADDRLEDLFNQLHRIYNYFNFKPQFQELKIINIQGFRLVGNFNFYIELWASLKESYFQEVELLSKHTKIVCILPSDLKLIFNEIDELLKKHSAIKHRELKANKFITDNELLDFGADESIIKNVFNILIKANGEWVKVRKIANDIDRSDSYTRTVLNQIKVKICNQRRENNQKIESSGKGSYRLLISE